MRKIVYRIFGQPVAPLNTGLIGSSDGRLYLDKAVFFQRDDVQSVIKDVKKSEVIKQQVRDAKNSLKDNAI